MYAIQVKDVHKRYKNGVQALDGLDLSVKRGEIFTLLGQNGAGKSTLIKILTTYLKPETGEVRMLGKDIYQQGDAIRSSIACVAQQTSIDTHLSLEENMMFQSRLYKIAKATAKRKMETLITDFGLESYRKYPVAAYSGGVKRRLDIALNMMSNPAILFLDEPTVGMDIQSRRNMWAMMKKIRDEFGTTIFLTTHYLEEADAMSDTICIMKDGKTVIQGSPQELRSYLHQNCLQVQFTSEMETKKYLPLLKEHFTQNEVYQKPTAIMLETQDNHFEMEKLLHFLLAQQITFQGVAIVQPTLEDVFLRLTQTRQEDNK